MSFILVQIWIKFCKVYNKQDFSEKFYKNKLTACYSFFRGKILSRSQGNSGTQKYGLLVLVLSIEKDQICFLDAYRLQMPLLFKLSVTSAVSFQSPSGKNIFKGYVHSRVEVFLPKCNYITHQ